MIIFELTALKKLIYYNVILSNKVVIMKIKIIEPVITEEFVEETEKEVEKFLSSDTEIDVEGIKYGTASIETSYDEYFCAPNILKIVEEAEKDGFDGIYINCFGDPGFEGAREVVDIPVVSAGHTSIFIAAELSHKFSILTILESSVPRDEEKVIKEGLSEKLASVRSIDIPVLDLEDRSKLTKALVKESKKAINEDGAHAIVLGCTGMVGLGDEIEKGLSDLGYYIPVVHPVPTSIKYLEMVINLNLLQSKRTYMNPTEKRRNLMERIK